MKAAEWALKIHDGIIATVTKLSGAADHASSQFTGLQQKVVAFEDALHRSEGTVSHFGNHVKGVFQEAKGYIAGAIGAYAGYQFTKDAISAYDAQAKAEAQLRAGILSTHGAAGISFEELKQQAEDLQKVTIFGHAQTEGAEKILLTFPLIKKAIFNEALPAIQDLSTRMGMDLSSASVMVGKALEDPIRGLLAMRRIGVSFTKEQEDHIKSLAQAGHMQAAQQEIVNELTREFGGSAKAAALAGMGPMQQLSNQWDDYKEKVGETIVNFVNKHKPQIEQFMHSMETAISKTMNGFLKLFGFIEDHWQIIKNIALIAGIIYGIVKAVQIATAVYEAWIIVTKALAVAQAWLDEAMIASPVGAFGMVIAGLAAAYLILTQNTNEATEAQRKLNDEHQKVYDAAERAKSAARDEEGGDFGNRINKIMQAHKQMDIVGAKQQAVVDELKRLDKVGAGYMNDWQKGKMTQSELYQQMMSVAEKKRILNDAGWVDQYTRKMGGSGAGSANGAPGDADAAITDGIGSINGGGKSVRNIYVTVQKMAEIHITPATIKEGLLEIKGEVEEVFTRILQGSEIAISNE